MCANVPHTSYNSHATRDRQSWTPKIGDAICTPRTNPSTKPVAVASNNALRCSRRQKKGLISKFVIVITVASFWRTILSGVEVKLRDSLDALR